MKVAVVGAGAMGSIVGGKIAASNEPVVLIDLWEAHRAVIRERGLTIESDGNPITVKCQIERKIPAGDAYDLAIVLVKSYHTQAAVEEIKSHLSPDGMLLSLQNGLGNEDIIAGIVGPERTLGGSLGFGGNVIAPGHVKYSNPSGAVYVGPLVPQAMAKAEAAARLLAKAGFNAHSHANILAVKWQKALLNVAISALVSILDMPNRVAGDEPRFRNAMIAACAEAIAVAKKKGIDLIGGDDPTKYVSSGIDPHSYEHRASMLMDLQNGKKTEIEFMNGAIERYGAEVGIPTPINTVLAAAIRRIEKERVN